jgi:hypothetical protein
MATLDVAQFGAATRGGSENAQGLLLLDSSGALVVIDLFAKLIQDGRGYQVRAGTVTTPLVGDVVITDAAAEYAVTAASGKVVVPVYQCISINLGGGTLHEYATKSVTGAHSGTAFVPLPLDTGGAACASTAAVAAAGAVTVTAELATTTRRHWSSDNPVAIGTGFSNTSMVWEPLRPPRITGGFCLYTQIAATTTGPSYYANLDFLELAAAQIGY